MTIKISIAVRFLIYYVYRFLNHKDTFFMWSSTKSRHGSVTFQEAAWDAAASAAGRRHCWTRPEQITETWLESRKGGHLFMV